MMHKHIIALSLLTLLFSLQSFSNPGEQKVSVPRLNLQQATRTTVVSTAAIEIITEPTPREEQKKAPVSADEKNHLAVKALSNEQILNSLKAQKSFFQSLDPAVAQTVESNKIEATITALETKNK